MGAPPKNKNAQKKTDEEIIEVCETIEQAICTEEEFTPLEHRLLKERIPKSTFYGWKTERDAVVSDAIKRVIELSEMSFSGELTKRGDAAFIFYGKAVLGMVEKGEAMKAEAMNEAFQGFSFKEIEQD